MRGLKRLAVVAMIPVLLVAVPQPASADVDTPSMANCIAGTAENDAWGRTWGPNNLTSVTVPSNMFEHDAFRIRAAEYPTYKIDYWGTNKSVNGEFPVAPSGWPAPGEKRYMVIARINQGTMFVRSRGRVYAADEWFPVGLDSGCLLYHGPNTGTFFTLSVNDTNISDNGGQLGNIFRQWW